MRTLKFAKTSELEGKQRAGEICLLCAPTNSRPLLPRSGSQENPWRDGIITGGRRSLFPPPPHQLSHKVVCQHECEGPFVFLKPKLSPICVGDIGVIIAENCVADNVVSATLANGDNCAIIADTDIFSLSATSAINLWQVLICVRFPKFSCLCFLSCPLPSRIFPLIPFEMLTHILLHLELLDPV